MPSLLALGLVLATATQLRLPGLPLGAGEGLLLAWAGLALARHRRTLLADVRALPRALGAVPGLLALTVALLVVAAAVHAGDPRSDGVAGLRDAAALGFAAVVSAALVLEVGSRRLDAEAVAWQTAVFTALGGLALLALAWSGAVPRLWTYHDIGYRFRAFAENPNQIALHVAALPALALAVRRSARDRVAVAGALVAVGASTGSSALGLGWIAALVALVPFALAAARGRVHGAARRRLDAGLGGLALAGLVGAAWAVARAVAAMQAPVVPGAKAAIRGSLWRSALAGIEASPLLGWGGGPHAGLSGPFGGLEAHNTVLDWALRVGVPGAALYVALVGGVALALLRRGPAAGLAALAALVVYGGFHNTMRQPVAWVVVALVHAAARRPGPFRTRLDARVPDAASGGTADAPEAEAREAEDAAPSRTGTGDGTRPARAA